MKFFTTAGILLLITVVALGSSVLDLTTGVFGGETYFTLVQIGVGTPIAFGSYTPSPTASLDDGFVVAGDLASSTAYQFTWDLGPGEYDLTVGDTFGDGMNGGNYELLVDGISVISSDGNFGESETNRFSVSAVPEPGTFGLIALGLAGFAIWRRRRTA